MAALIKHFNASEYSRIELYPKQGQKSSGKADHFFCNGYFRIQELKDMALNLLPLPVPLKRDVAHQAAAAGRCAADFGGDAGGHGGSPASPAPASAGENIRDRKWRQRRSSGSSSSRESHSGGEYADSSSSSGVQEQRRSRRRSRSSCRPGKAEIEKMRKSIDAESGCSESEKRMWDAGDHDPVWRAKLDRAAAYYVKAKTGRNIKLDKLRNCFKIAEAKAAAAAAASAAAAAARGEGAATTAAVAEAEAAAACIGVKTSGPN